MIWKPLATKEQIKAKLNTTGWFTETTALDSFIEDSVSEFSQNVGDWLDNSIVDTEWIEERFDLNDMEKFKMGNSVGRPKNRVFLRFFPVTGISEIRHGGTNREDSEQIPSSEYYIANENSVVFHGRQLTNSYLGISYRAGFQTMPAHILSIVAKFVKWKHEAKDDHGEIIEKRAIGGSPDPSRAGVMRFKLDGAFYVEYSEDDHSEKFILTKGEMSVLSRYYNHERVHDPARVFQAAIPGG